MSIDAFDDLPLAEPLLQALREENYHTPTPIQAQAIPPQLEGRDLIGCAQTGTGKTAAFALPILHHLASRRGRPQRGCTRVLVLTPTRELAIQVGKSFATYGRHLRLSSALIYGGVSQHPQTRALARGVDIVVATPGRLLDLLEQGHLRLNQVEFLVLDEVDRMLDMGFVHDVRRIATELPAKRQTVLFTATLTSEVESIAAGFVSDPVRVAITPEKPTVDNIDQKVCFVRSDYKLPLLETLLREQSEREGLQSTLIFARTKFGAEKLAAKLNHAGFICEAMHGDKSQAARERSLDKFRKGKAAILVATDVAARGIDVRSISLVINFDLPEAADTYVHRIGRTARATATGTAISFVGPQEVGLLAAIEKYIRKKIPVDTRQPFHDAETADRSSHHSHRPRPGPVGRSGPRGQGSFAGRRGKPSRGSTPFAGGKPFKGKRRAQSSRKG